MKQFDRRLSAEQILALLQEPLTGRIRTPHQQPEIEAQQGVREHLELAAQDTAEDIAEFVRRAQNASGNAAAHLPSAPRKH